MYRSRPVRQRAASPVLRAIEPLEPRTLLSAQLVADLNTTPASSNPSATVQANGFTFFVADDGLHGREVWRTDGTAEGTAMIADLAVGPDSRSPILLGAVGNDAYFCDKWGMLWHTDGTAANTRAFDAATNTSVALSSPATTAVMGGVFYAASSNHLYRASGGRLTEVTLPAATDTILKVVTSGSKLYLLSQNNILLVSDGTSAGTTVLSQLGAASDIAELNGFVYFSRLDGSTSKYQLLKTQGTTATTSLVTTLPAVAKNMAVAGQTLYFWSGQSLLTHTGALWKSDGTSDGTSLVKDVPLPKSPLVPPLPTLLPSSGKVFFGDTSPGFSPPQTTKLWVSDGTADGTFIVSPDVNPLSGGAPYSSNVMFDWNGTVLFQGRDAATGCELWQTDGTAAGTVRVADIAPGADGSFPQILAVIGSRVLLAASTPATGHELWTTDGTAAGTSLFKDLSTGTAGSTFSADPAAVNGRLLFAAANRLMVIADPSAPPQELTFADPSLRLTGVGSLTPAGTRAYFTAAIAGMSDTQLCVTDGTPAGTRVVAKMPDYGGSNYTAVGERLFFITSGPFAAQSVYTSDGTPEGTVALATGFYFYYITYALGSLPRPSFGSDGTRFYFSARVGGSDNPTELWVSDGTPAGTMRLLAFSTSIGLATNVTPANGRTYFYGGDNRLYRTDGTPAGTSVVGDGTGLPVGTAPDGALLLDRSGQLQRLGLTDAAPAPLANVSLGSLLNVRLGKWIYFVGGAGDIWRTDGTANGTAKVVDAYDAADLTAAGGLLYFTDFNATQGRELWVTDGTPGGTHLVGDIVPGPGAPAIAAMTPVNDTLFFTATDGVHGRELWRADEVPPTVLASSFNYAANPQTLTVTFTENVGDSLALSDWKLLDRTTGQDVSTLLTSLSFNPDTDLATLTLASNLPAGDYRLTLPAGAAADRAGNPTAAEISLDFWHLPGDVNRDRTVNFDDLLVLATSYNKTSVGYGNGDLNGDGTVNFDDLLILAKNYGMTLPALPVTTAAAAAPALALATAPTTTTADQPRKPKPVFSVAPTSPKRPPAPPKQHPKTRKAR